MKNVITVGFVFLVIGCSNSHTPDGAKTPGGATQGLESVDAAKPQVASDDVGQDEPTFRGKPTSYWITKLAEEPEAAAHALVEIGPTSVPHLVKALSDSEKRLGALSALSQIGHEAKPALPALVALWKEKESVDQLMHHEVMRALTAIGPEPAVIECLSKDLASDNESTWYYAIHFLGSLAPEGTEAIPVLIEALKERFGIYRSDAVKGLSAFGPKAKAAVPALQKLLTDPDDKLRLLAQEALNSIDTESSVPALIEKLEDPKASLPDRLAALNRLSCLGHQAKSAVPTLLKTVKDPNRDVRFQAALALARTGAEPSLAIPLLLEVAVEFDWRDPQIFFALAVAVDEDAVAPLIQALSHKDARVRQVTLELMGLDRPLPDSVLPSLILTLKDQDPAVRVAGLSALSRFASKSPAANDAIKKALNDPVPSVRDAAMQALEATESEDALIERLRRELKPNSSRDSSFVATLSQLGPRAAELVPALIETLKQDQDPYRRALCAHWLGRIAAEPRSAVPAIVEALEGNVALQVEHRATIVRALGGFGPDAREAVPALRIVLKDPDATKDLGARVRIAAVEALGEIGEPAKDAVPDLIAALQDKQPPVRAPAAKALGSIAADPEKTIPALIQSIRDDLFAGYSTGDEAAEALAAFGPKAMDPLLPLLAHQNSRVRAAAVRACYFLGSDAEVAVPGLGRALKDDDTVVVLYAIEALQNIGPAAKDAVPALIETLKEKDPEVRKSAMTALAGIGPGAVASVPAIIAAIKDPDPEIGHAAIESLGWMRADSKEVVPALIAALKSEHQATACQMLGRLGPAAKDAVPALIQALKDPKFPLRAEVPAALAQIGADSEVVLATLLDVLNDPKEDLEVRAAACAGLGSIGSTAKPAIPDIIKALQSDKGSYLGMVAAEALGKFPKEADVSVPALIAALNASNKDPAEYADVRESVCTALGNLGPAAKAAVPDLLNVLSDQSDTARVSAAQALGRIGSDPRILPLLLNLLNDPNESPETRAAACRALGSMGTDARPAIPALIRALESNRTLFLHFVAAEALGKFPDDSAEVVPVLIAALTDKDIGVRIAVWEALGNHGPAAKAAVAGLIRAMKTDGRYNTQTRQQAANALSKIDPAAAAKVGVRSRE